MTLEEKLDMAIESIELKKAGKLEEADKLLKAVPLAPHLAMVAKEVFGVDFMRRCGLNLSEAEEVYGKDWLER